MDGVKYAKYENDNGPDGYTIKKDGHTMFPQDIVADLNRKSYLEGQNAKLRAGIQAAVDGLWSWIYSRKSRRIHDIYDSLKAALGGCNG